jgi:hypothetical protein
VIDAGSMQSSVRAAPARTRRCIGFIAYVTAFSCGGHTDGGAANAPMTVGKSDSGSGGSTLSFGSGGRAGSGGSTSSGGAFDAGPQPVVSCGPGSDASADLLDGASCAPPPSHCIDEHTLAYYTDERCGDGLCSWTTQILTCPTVCVVGGCQSNVTFR